MHQESDVGIPTVSLRLTLTLMLGPLDHLMHTDICVGPDWSRTTHQTSVKASLLSYQL